MNTKKILKLGLVAVALLLLPRRSSPNTVPTKRQPTQPSNGRDESVIDLAVID